MRKKIFIAAFLFLDVLFIIFIISGLVKLRQVKKAQQEAQEAVISEEETLVRQGIPIRKFKVEQGYPGVVELGEFKIREGEPEEGLEKRAEISGYVLEGPRLSSDNQMVVRLGFPKGEKKLVADVLLGTNESEIGIYLPAKGVITASQEWTIMKVSEIISLHAFQKGNQIIIELSLEGVPETVINDPQCDEACKLTASQINTYYQENLAFLEDLKRGEGELRTIGPVIQMIAWPKEKT